MKSWDEEVTFRVEVRSRLEEVGELGFLACFVIEREEEARVAVTALDTDEKVEGPGDGFEHDEGAVKAAEGDVRGSTVVELWELVPNDFPRGEVGLEVVEARVWKEVRELTLALRVGERKIGLQRFFFERT